MLDLLDAIAKEDITAIAVRETLLDAVDVLYEQAGCYYYESREDKLSWCARDGGCPTCQRQRSSFARHVETMTERWRRWTLPDQFPFAKGSSKGLHTVGCGVVRRHMPDGFSEPDPDDPVALRAFAHARDVYDYDFSPQEPEQLPGHVPFHPMSPEETRVLMAKNTGPKGGRHYKRCQHCAPTQ